MGAGLLVQLKSDPKLFYLGTGKPTMPHNRNLAVRLSGLSDA